MLGCCPALAVAGVAAGALSVYRINHANGLLRGKSIAVTAMVLGVFLGLASWWTSQRFESTGKAALLAEVRRGVDQLLEGAVDPTAWWTGVEPAALIEFQRRIIPAVGAMRVATVTPTQTSVGLEPRMTLRLLLEGSGESRIASVEVVVTTDLATMLPSARICFIEIGTASLTPEGGEEQDTLRFPPVSP